MGEGGAQTPALLAEKRRTWPIDEAGRQDGARAGRSIAMARKRAKKPARKMSKSRPAKKTARPVETAAAAIRRLDAEFMRAAAAHDGAALAAAFYDKDAVLLPPNSPALEGRESIRQMLQGLMDSGLTSSSGDLAYGRGRYTMNLEPAGGSPVTDVGKYVVVYRRQAGAWRAVADIFNSDQAAT
jgi:ketosteroid isomerase-like protein